MVDIKIDLDRIKQLRKIGKERLSFAVKSKRNIVRKLSELESDITAVNRLFKKEEPAFIEVERAGTRVRVDYDTGDIYVNGNKIDLQLDDATLAKCIAAGFRWINFQRHRISYRAGPNVPFDTYLHVVGWQATVDGKNIQRMVAIDEKGNWELWKKR